VFLMKVGAKFAIATFISVFGFAVAAGAVQQAGIGSPDDPEARPPLTADDVKIVQRAREILNAPAKWNRADTRKCPADASTFSLYCALEKATMDTTGDFKHRGAAMQEARFVIDEVAPNRSKYEHRLKDYNNDPTTTFADIQKVLRLTEDRITKRLKENPPPSPR
jgi:hypothetical protein